MTIFAASVFDATVIYEGNELFKGQGAAKGWAEKLARELKCEVGVEKLGTGWVLTATVHEEPCKWSIVGQRLKRMD